MNNENLIIITTTLSNNEVSEKRRTNLINNFSKYNLSVILNHGIQRTSNLDNKEIMYKIIVNAFETFKKCNYEYAIICDDDFYPIDNFLNELNNTVSLLPKNWQSLHLCPGYLWGRQFRDMTKLGKINPEYNMENISFDISDRFYNNCNPKKYYNCNFWLGGPIAMLVNKNSINNILENFKNTYKMYRQPNDVILTLILDENSFICKNPQLGYENEEGGSTYT